MAIRIIVGLVVLLAILQGLAADAVPGGIVAARAGRSGLSIRGGGD